MSSTQHLSESKKVNFTINGEVICTHYMTLKEMKAVVKAMKAKGYDLEVTSCNA